MILAGLVLRRRSGEFGKPEGKKPLGRPNRRWENIKVDLQKVGRDMDWIDLVQCRYRWQAFVCVVMKLRVS